MLQNPVKGTFERKSSTRKKNRKRRKLRGRENRALRGGGMKGGEDQYAKKNLLSSTRRQREKVMT